MKKLPRQTTPDMEKDFTNESVPSVAGSPLAAASPVTPNLPASPVQSAVPSLGSESPIYHSGSPAGTPTNPFIVKIQTADEFRRHTDEFIAERHPFKGRWHTVLDGNQLVLPAEYIPLFEHGGVVTSGTESQLMLFGIMHWERMLQMISTQFGLSNAGTDIMRLVYTNHHEFKLTDKGTIELPQELIDYANLQGGLDSHNQGKNIIVGLLYYAEVHNRSHYDDLMSADKIDQINGLLK